MRCVGELAELARHQIRGLLADVDGVIVTIYPQNGQPVEYGEKLFAVKAQS